MDAASDRLSTAALATDYASARGTDWVETLSRADANGVAIPVIEWLFAGDEAAAVDSLHARDGPIGRDGPTGAHRAGSRTADTSRDAPSSRYLAAELCRRRARLEQFGRDLALVDEILADRGIPYAVIKTNVDHAYRPWDVNVLVAEDNWPAVHRRLVDRGWYRTSLRAHPLARTEPGKRLYEHDVRHPVHLHRAVSWNGLTYLPAETVLESRIRKAGVSYPDPVVDAAIHCAHSVFENFSLRLFEATTVARRFGDDADDNALERGRELAESNGWPYGFELARTTAGDVVDRLRRAPATADLPASYATADLARAWLQHARRADGGWYEVPLNAALRLKP